MRIFIDSMTLLRVESDQYIDQITLPSHTIKWVKNEGYFQYFQTERPIELHVHDQITINGEAYPLEIGLVTLTKEFETRFRYDGKLGYDYSPASTTFSVFSPVAKEVFVVIDDVSYPMTYHEPIWERTVDGDFNGKQYVYRVRLVDQFVDVMDPYGNAMSSSGSHVIDWKNLIPINPTPIKLKNYVDAVIYEGHVRDMTIDLDVYNQGLYDGLSEKSKLLKGSVLQYIKRLGMTHLQLLPVFDFEGVDDLEKKSLYNWGYNPSTYFGIEGWYSKDPKNPMERINEFRELINEAHRLKLGINMDVVYNHVYNHMTYPYDKLVPGYFYRHNPLKKMTNSSYCGNDVETRNYMVRKLIIDSLIHFNDFYRNTMKGELHGQGLGYTMGNKNLMTKAMDAIIGSPSMFLSPNQSINYVECHDNMTYYDKMLLSCGFERDSFKVCQDFANHLIAISQGIPFYHAGQEFYRSKMGVENSYNSPDEINQITWNPKAEAVDKLKKLLKIRKQHKLYRNHTYASNISIRREQQTIIYELENHKEKLIHYIKCESGIEKFSLHEGDLIFPSQSVLTEETDFYVDKPGIYIIKVKK